MASIGNDALITLVEVLNVYFDETALLLSDAYYTVGSLFVVIYVFVIGYLALKGKIGDSLGQVIGLMFSVPIAFTIFFNPAITRDWVLEPLLSTMLGLMSIVMGGEEFSFSTLFTPVDSAFAAIFTSLDDITNQMGTWDIGLKVKVFFISLALGLIFAFLYAVFSLLIIGSIFSIYVLMVLAPIFGVFAAFKPTRHYFWAWLKSMITYALIPVFTAIVMGVTLIFLKSALVDISSIDVVENGVFTKSIGAALFVGLLSIYLHLKAPEYASAITGTQSSGVGGFLSGVTGGAIAGGSIAGATYMKMGGGNLNAGAKSLGAAGARSLGEGAGTAYRRARGFL